ncbi:MAG: Helix-turn-helix protein [Massilia sp.]|nr:Helix-turn-helix protein [Massilia sp.]
MSSEWAEQPAQPDNHGVPGRTLAAQRESMGWTVEQVADQLKLAVRQVVALEAGDYASLPGPAVVRGFVRAYAKIVKLDPVPLVALIALDAPGPTDATGTTLRRDKPASFSEVRFPSHGKRASLPLVPIFAVLVVAAAAAAAWHFGLIPRGLVRSDGATASAPLATTAVVQPNVAAPAAGAPVTGTPATSAVEINSLQNPSVPLISVPPPSSVSAGGAATGAGGAAGAAPSIPPAAGASAAAGANALVLTVREDSWVELKRAKGAPLISRVVKAGTTESFDITEPVTLVVGKPGAVSATLRGAAVELPQSAAGAVSRINLK